MQRAMNCNNFSRRLFPLTIFGFLALFFTFPSYGGEITVLPKASHSQSFNNLEKRVVDIFARNCTRAGCHSGTYPQMGMRLTEADFYSNTINRPSIEKPEMVRIKPGDPDSSYLVQKILGGKEISGLRMPFGRDALSETEIAAIVEWIKEMQGADESRIKPTGPVVLLPFRGWKVVNLPTARMLDRGQFLFLIGHRFFPKINSGYDTFFGLDGSGGIFLNLGYAVTNNLFVNLGRSNISDDVELDLKYGIKHQYDDSRLPVAVAVQTSLNWFSEKTPGKDRLRSEALKFSAQAVFSSQVYKGVAINFVPGILFNPDINKKNEDPLITLGVGGRIALYGPFSLVGEWAPIVSGYTLTTTSGEFNRFDSWGGGVEVWIGGHVFQLFVTNSMGTATDQYLRGGDLGNGDMRLGFNIFRILQF